MTLEKILNEKSFEIKNIDEVAAHCFNFEIITNSKIEALVHIQCNYNEDFDEYYLDDQYGEHSITIENKEYNFNDSNQDIVDKLDGFLREILSKMKGETYISLKGKTLTI